MTTVIVFSKNRAAQLDLLLRSIDENAPSLFEQVYVVWKGEGEYAAAYRICQDEHRETDFIEEQDLRSHMIGLVEEAGDCVSFLMDDCVFYRQPRGRGPSGVLQDDDNVLCFSLRLGLNTTECYSLRQPQARPLFDSGPDGILYWEWARAECDYSYPASLDGHVFRRDDLLALLDEVNDWRNPNAIESELARLVIFEDGSLMACHEYSSLVGVPVNRVNHETHQANRVGETYRYETAGLNSAYLKGKRIRRDSIDPDKVNAAHVEFPLRLA